MLVLRKKPGSYDATEQTEIWMKVERGEISDPQASDFATDKEASDAIKNGHGNVVARKMEGSLITREQAKRWLPSETTIKDGLSTDAATKINNQMADTRNSSPISVTYVMKPGYGPGGSCEEMKFLIKRVHGMTASDYSVTAFEDGTERPRFN